MSRCYIQLSRTGDILGILPMLHLDYLKGERASLMVAKEYAPLLDGVSYVDPIVYDGPPHEIDKAVAQARALGHEVVCTQVNGPADMVRVHTYETQGMEKALTTNFQKEQWRVAGRLEEWHTAPALLFDQRDAAREKALFERYMVQGDPRRYVLVSVSGNSSPFPYSELLLRLLEMWKAPKVTVIDISQVRAERFYDMLALYENANTLIATDSAPLHLAQACPTLPVFALTQDKPILWNGAPWRANHYFHCRYSDFPVRACEMIDKLTEIGPPNRRVKKRPVVVHVWNEYKGPVRDKVWTYVKTRWSEMPVEKGACGRDSENQLGDKKRNPYLRDVLKMAFLRAQEGDFICVTRSDTAAGDVFATITAQRACFANRIDRTDAGEMWSPVVDLFCATKEWWLLKYEEIPDLVMGGDHYWSEVLWGMFFKAGAKDVTGCVHRRPARSSGDGAGKAMEHNGRLKDDFMVRAKVHARYPKASEQVEVLPIARKLLRNYGYNMTITQDKDHILACYRFHEGTSFSTKLAIAQIAMDGQVISNGMLAVPNDGQNAVEDPRFWQEDGVIHMSWVESTWPTAAKSIVKTGRIVDGTLEYLGTDNFPGNNWSGMQKNWIYWYCNNRRYCFYKSVPVQSYFDFGQNKWIETEGPKWAYGPIKGGTPPVPYEGKLLRFFHSTVDNDRGQSSRRYFVGACIMEPEPPFQVVKVSSRPILYGSELDDLTPDERRACFHRKPSVVFPAGIIPMKDHWLLSCGVNDCQSVILKIYPSQLHL